MNHGIYAITVIGESLSGEKNLVLILEIIRNCGKNVIGENKKMHYVVSDIHNDYQKFCELLKVIKFSKEDKLFILGDLFDRSDYNPNPVDLYFKVMELGDNCSMIRGNHDEWLAAYILKYYQMPEWKRRKTEPYQYNTFRCLTRRLVEVDVQNLARQILTWPLQLSAQVNNEKYLLAHAMTSKPECTENKYYYLMGNEMNPEYFCNGVEGYISICGHSAYCKLSSEQEPVSFRAYPHIGMIQDSFTISGDGCLIKLSYLLHPNNIEFYCELTAKMPLFVENIGNEVLYVDTHSGLIKLVPGERKEVKVENVEQEEQSLPSCDLYPAEIIE